MNHCIQHVLFTDVLRLSVPEVPSANTIGRGIQTADCRAPTRTNKTHFANICKGTPTRADHSRRQEEIGQAATFIEKYQSVSAKGATNVSVVCSTIFMRKHVFENVLVISNNTTHRVRAFCVHARTHASSYAHSVLIVYINIGSAL